MTDPNIGCLIANRYQLQELIGTGAMGRVYRAEDTLLGGVAVAVKFLSLSIHSQRIRVNERFEREAKTSALLSQKSIHIVRVMDYGVDKKGTPFYVMEYLSGESLSDVIRRRPLSLRGFLSMARQICLGLQCAHQGIFVDGEICPIIHRDIKPSNILVVPDPSFGELVKILDFGIAKLIQSSDSAKTNCYLGTLTYSSPEQMEGQELDNRSDIYSLGVMMFEMLTSKIPVQANIESFGGWYKAHHFQLPRSFASADPRLEVPQEVENLVMKCLAKAPSARFQNISEILQTLASLEQHLGQSIVNQAITPGVKSVERSQTIPREELTLSVDEVEQLPSWPKNKPLADILFPHPIEINNNLIPALWIMLPQQEIQKRLFSTRYNQFLFITSPHPMILWVTVLHNHEYGPKWFPYYLDLKSQQGQEITRLLGETGGYRLLMFAREIPQRVCACLSLNIAPAQTKLLQQWAITSQSVASDAEPQVSKSLLKTEYEKLKPQILNKLKGINPDYSLTPST